MKPVANVSMLIRAPAAEVFNAFIDPNVLSRFWLARASAPLGEGRSVTWEFKVPGVTAVTRVREIEENRRLVLEWEGNERAEFSFEQRSDGFTRIEVNSAAMGQTPEEAMANAIEATQGYTLVVANLKAFLESHRSAGLVEDKALLIAEKQAQAG